MWGSFWVLAGLRRGVRAWVSVLYLFCGRRVLGFRVCFHGSPKVKP